VVCRLRLGVSIGYTADCKRDHHIPTIAAIAFASRLLSWKNAVGRDVTARQVVHSESKRRNVGKGQNRCHGFELPRRALLGRASVSRRGVGGTLSDGWWRGDCHAVENHKATAGRTLAAINGSESSGAGGEVWMVLGHCVYAVRPAQQRQSGISALGRPAGRGTGGVGPG
jgi:hypothetical protein